MPLGDSITEGASANAPNGLVPGGYRAPLYTDLEQQGITVNYEGASNVNPSLVLGSQTSNNGYGGYFISDLTNNLKGVATPGQSLMSNQGGYWLNGGNGTGRSAQSPDVILLMIGTNDIGQSYDPLNNPAHPFQTASGTIFFRDMTLQYETLLNNLVADEPQATILVGSILPFYLYNVVGQFDTTLQSLITTNYSNDKVHYVDFYDTFNDPARSGLLNPLYDGGDGIHPNAAGYAEMATIWDNAILNDVNLADYEAPEPSTWALFIGGGLALIGWRKFRARKA